jgi:PRC-barrel domain
MDHNTQSSSGSFDLNEADLIGTPIYDIDGEKVGSISHLHHAATSRQAVVDVGGFLGIGTKPVLVSLDDLTIQQDPDGNVYGVTSWTKDQITALPEHYD